MPRLLALLLVALLAGAACSDSDEPDVASLGGEGDGATAGDGTSSGDTEAALLDFSECMRTEGVTDFPDLSTGGNPFTAIADSGIDVQSDLFEAALETCQPIIEDVVSLDDLDPEALAEIQDDILALARCVRERGFDVPDPDFSAGIGPEMFGDLNELGIDFTDPEFASALRECFTEVGFPGAGGAATPGDAEG